MDFTQLGTLLSALDGQNFKCIRQCLNAGQSLNQTNPSEQWGEDIFHNSCALETNERFMSMIAMRKHVNLNALDKDGANTLFYCNTCFRLDILFRYGVNMHTIADTYEQGKCNAFEYTLMVAETNKRNMSLMLLSVGSDPRNAEIPENMKTEVRRWVASLDCAKRLFAKIFDNDSLERELRDFLYNEPFLRKALSN